MQNAVLATLSGTEQCQHTVDALKRAGFTTDDISVMLPDDYGASELGFCKRNKCLEGMAIGLMIGLVAGLLVSYIAVSRNIGIPEIENIFTATPAYAVLSTVALCSGILGLIGLAIGASMIEYVVKKYERRTRLGSSILSIHVDNLTELRVAEKILKGEGAQEIGVIGEDHRKKEKVHLTPTEREAA